jgi:hypothetical protein
MKRPGPIPTARNAACVIAKATIGAVLDDLPFDPLVRKDQQSRSVQVKDALKLSKRTFHDAERCMSNTWRRLGVL